MRAALIRLSCLLSLLIASSASAVTMAWTPVGNPGNACDPQPQGCFGAVGYAYDIGTYDVTNAQYVEFLNAKAASDPLGLYNTHMSDPTQNQMGQGLGGITRSGNSGSYSYSVIAGRGDMPVNNVSFWDALRFANWMNHGQGSGDTETGAYTLLGGTATPSNGNTVGRNEGATILLTSENEWYKAAYYNALLISYFAYPAGSNAPTTCTVPTAAANSANCNNAVGDLTLVGSYTGSRSPYGTYDQGGNVDQWNEAPQAQCCGVPTERGLRGGAFKEPPGILGAGSRGFTIPDPAYSSIGFRLVMIPGGFVVPEPGTGLLVIAGLLGFAGWRRARD